MTSAARPTKKNAESQNRDTSPRLVEVVFAKVAEIRRGGMTILLVEQNARAALAVSDRAYVLVEGQNRHEGRAESLWRDADLARLYLGAREDALPATVAP